MGKWFRGDRGRSVNGGGAQANISYEARVAIRQVERKHLSVMEQEPAPPDRWIALDHHPNGWDDKPRWSPNGNLIYFVSDRDGYLCLWAQRLANRTKELAGKPFRVYHVHNARLSMANLDTGIIEIGVAKDKIIVGLGELTGNVWSMKRSSK